jgi:glucose-1-phosphatase
MQGPHNASPLQLIIFDMDEVLCRYDRPLRLRRLAAISARTPEEIFAAIWQSGFEANSEAGAIDAAVYLRGFGERMGYPLTRSQWVEARRMSMTPFPDMLSLAGRIKQSVSVAVLTNNGFLTKETIALLFPELPPLFEPKLLFTAEFAARKPDPQVYHRMLARLGVAPDAALMVDDDADNVAGGSRVRPDGYRLSWLVAQAPKPFMFQAPFLIKDQTPREERIGKETNHPNGVTGVAAITVATDDVARVRGWWSPVLGQPGSEIERADIDAAGVRFTAGPHTLDFVAPRNSSGPVARWLKARGPSPYAIVLRTSGGKAGPLDEAKAGTRITLVST